MNQTSSKTIIRNITIDIHCFYVNKSIYNKVIESDKSLLKFVVLRGEYKFIDGQLEKQFHIFTKQQRYN